MILWLRIVVCCFFLVLCTLFAALWVRSCHYQDAVIRTAHRVFDPAEQMNIILENRVVRLEMITSQSPIDGEIRWSWLTNPLRASQRPPANMQNNRRMAKPPILGFQWTRKMTKTSYLTQLQFPIWFFVFITGLLACAAKPKPRWQFGMRELLVLSTVGATTVGILVAVLRVLSDVTGH